MGKENVELRVHMYHEPVGTRVTRVYECAKWIRLGGSPSEGRSGEVPLWVETESDGAPAVFPRNRRNGRPGYRSAVSRPLLEYSHDLRSLHVLEAVAWARISDPCVCEVRAPEGGTLSVRMILAQVAVCSWLKCGAR